MLACHGLAPIYRFRGATLCVNFRLAEFSEVHIQHYA